jgi:cytoskeletal protein RodZ
MLKYWLALLLVLHALVLAWHWDAYAPWGHGPHQQREPERMKQLVRPEALKFEVMSPSEPTTAPAATDASTESSAVSPAADASGPDRASLAPALPSSAAAAPRAKPQ